MTKSFLHGFVVLTIVLAGFSPALSGPNGPPDGAKIAPLPESKAGSQWTLRYANGFETTSIISSVKNDKLFFADGRVSSMERNTIEGRGLTGAWVVYSPHLRNYSFPLWEGKKWGGWVTWTSGQYSGSFRMKAEAVAWEMITVPAGTFEALRIENSSDIKLVSTCWYSVLAEFPMKCEFHQQGQSFELVGYKLVK